MTSIYLDHVHYVSVNVVLLLSIGSYSTTNVAEPSNNVFSVDTPPKEVATFRMLPFTEQNVIINKGNNMRRPVFWSNNGRSQILQRSHKKIDTYFTINQYDL